VTKYHEVSLWRAAGTSESLEMLEGLLKEDGDRDRISIGIHLAATAAVLAGNTKALQFLFAFEKTRENFDFPSLIQTALLSDMFKKRYPLLLEAATGGMNTPSGLQSAQTAGSVGVVLLLVDKGAKIQDRSSEGEDTLLIAACRAGSVDMVRLLLDKGVKIRDYCSKGEDTLLVTACRAGSIDMVCLLLDKGTKIRDYSSKGEDILLVIVCQIDSVDIVRLLLDKGVEI
jgi:ankyrin repeat protein